MHNIHAKPRRVLGDDCEECLNRARTGLNGLSELDDFNLIQLAVLAEEMKAAEAGTGTNVPENASNADMQAMETLRLAARLVYRSGITEEAAK